MENINIKVGMVDVYWDYDDLNEVKKANYEFDIKVNNDKYTYRNTFHFMKDDKYLYTEYTESDIFKLYIIEKDKNIKVYICGDIIVMNEDQYNLILEKTKQKKD